MSIEENKNTHKKLVEEVWINRDLDAVDEVYNNPFGINERTYSIDEGKEFFNSLWDYLDKEGKKLIKVDYHFRVGEGDLLAVWQTSHYEDGSSAEGMNMHQFKDGKVAKSQWFSIFKSEE